MNSQLSNLSQQNTFQSNFTILRARLLCLAFSCLLRFYVHLQVEINSKSIGSSLQSIISWTSSYVLPSLTAHLCTKLQSKDSSDILDSDIESFVQSPQRKVGSMPEAISPQLSSPPRTRTRKKAGQEHTPTHLHSKTCLSSPMKSNSTKEYLEYTKEDKLRLSVARFLLRCCASVFSDCVTIGLVSNEDGCELSKTLSDWTELAIMESWSLFEIDIEDECFVLDRQSLDSSDIEDSQIQFGVLEVPSLLSILARIIYQVFHFY